MLGQLWRGGVHAHFPETAWAYFTGPELADPRRTPRDDAVETWKESGRLGDDPTHPAPERVALFFGEGGHL